MGDVWTALSDGGKMRSIIGVNGDDDPGLYLKPEFEELGVDVDDAQVVVDVDQDERTITIDCGPERR